jgi:hypothetical protein
MKSSLLGQCSQLMFTVLTLDYMILIAAQARDSRLKYEFSPKVNFLYCIAVYLLKNNTAIVKDIFSPYNCKSYLNISCCF